MIRRALASILNRRRPAAVPLPPRVTPPPAVYCRRDMPAGWKQ